MKKYILLLLAVFSMYHVYGQYTKEKIATILTNDSEKSWTVSGLNTETKDKGITFFKDHTIKITTEDGKSKSDKWVLKSNDNIRWFLDFDKRGFEVIISYDKKGSQYLKLVRQDGRAFGNYEIRLTPEIKSGK